MYVENRTKIADFPTPVYLTPPLMGFPLEFSIAVRSSECSYDGAIIEGRKSFPIGFVVLIQYRM